MGKAISAKASYNPAVMEALFGTRERARETVRSLLDAQERGANTFKAHGMTLVRKRSVVVIQGK
jgi:hypothetical protein